MSCCCGSQTKKKNVSVKKCNCAVQYQPCKCPNLIGMQKLLRKNKGSKRIKYLARPRRRNSKFHRCSMDPHNRLVQIIREPKISTRLEQLAVRPVRYLVSARDEYRSFINPLWYNRFNRAIHKSMYTMYSRLANVQLPSVRFKRKKWTQEDWDKHNIWLAERALPKPEKKQPCVKREWKPIEEMKRIQTLSKPKHLGKKFSGCSLFGGPITKVKQSAIDYIPSKRICTLSMPKNPREKGRGEECDAPHVSLGARQYKPTERIQTLSQPKKYKNAESDQKENPFQVPPNALKAKASERVIELAKPRTYDTE